MRASTGNRALALAVAAVLLTASAAFGDDAGSTAYAQIEPSLALVIAPVSNKSIGTGTAFCVGSGNDEAFFLTNHHVVGNNDHVAMILLVNRSQPYKGDVIRVGAGDAAVIVVHNTSCKPLTLSTATPEVGTRVAIAGFPYIQLELARSPSTLEPSFHQGTVSSITADGSLIEYDAQTDHGNSGSPLFDAQNGTVYGLVTWVNTGVTHALQNNFAISTSSLRGFLGNAHADVSFTTSHNDGNKAAFNAAPGTVAPGTVGAAVDARCGQGTSRTILTSIEKAWGEINANDYTTAVADAQSGIVAANGCAVFVAPSCQNSSPCDDATYIFMLDQELFGQQLLRLAAARNGGDWGYAEKNEIGTALIICNSPNIQAAGKAYQFARNGITETFRVYHSNYRARQTSGVDIDSVRACAQKLNIPF